MKKVLIIGSILIAIGFIVWGVSKYNKQKKELATLKSNPVTTDTATNTVIGVKLHPTTGLTTVNSSGEIIPLFTIAEIEQIKLDAIAKSDLD